MALTNEDLTRLLHSTTDASVWAKEFVRLHGGDEGLMLGWFANAIEVGRSAGARQTARRMREVLRGLADGLDDG